MTPERWAHLKEIFTQALDREGAERERFLEEACAGDAGLLQAVHGLLAQHDDAGEFLSSPAAGFTPGDAPHLFEPGDLVAGRFRIERFLARGGMGEVYEAEDQTLAQRVALKAIQRGFQTEQAVQYLKQEIQAARRVTHPNVCRIYDLAEHGSPPLTVLTMELLDGPTLSRHLKDAGPFTRPQALPLIRQIGAGLQAAHDAGVVHRDFKAGNVILTGSAGAWRPVITDFGLALSPQSRSRESSPRGGTPGYMAPEQIQGKPATPATDVYAFGVAIAAMLGIRPERLTGTPGERKKLGGWRRVVERCIRADPESRYQRPADVVRALEHTRFSGLLLAAAVVLVALIAGWWWWRSSHPPGGGFVARKVVDELREDDFWALSRDGRWLAATDWTDPEDDPLVIRDLQHNLLRRLTPSRDVLSQVIAAVISPDDSRIAYLLFEDAGFQTRIVNSQGGGDRLLLRDPSVRNATPKAWTADGTQVIVSTTWTDGSSGLGLLALDTGLVTPVSQSEDAARAGRVVFWPSGNEILYTARQRADQSNGDIFAVGVDGSNERRIVAFPSDDYVVGLAPGGALLVFVSDRSGSPGIWTLALDTPGAAPELAVADLGYFDPLGFTPDGALYYKVSRDYTTVYTAVLDLAARRTAGPPVALGLGGYLSWSRDGSELAYVASAGRLRPTLIFWNPITQQSRELALRLRSLSRPQWRTATSLAGFGTGQGPDGYLDIDARTGATRLLLGREAADTSFEGAWSADGNTWYSRFEGNRSGLFRYDLRTGAKETVFTPDAGANLGQENLALSPDGGWLAFQVRSGGASTLMVLPTGGGEPQPLRTVQPPDFFHFGAFTWLPDASGLLVAQSRRPEEASELWLVPRDGSAAQPVEFPRMRIRNLRLNPDGRTIAFFSGAMNSSEIRVLENFLPSR